MGIAAEQTAMYFPIVPWQEEIKVNQWKEEEKELFEYWFLIHHREDSGYTEI